MTMHGGLGVRRGRWGRCVGCILRKTSLHLCVRRPASGRIAGGLIVWCMGRRRSPFDRFFKTRFCSESVKETPPGTLPAIPDIVIESHVRTMCPSCACVLIPPDAVDCVTESLIH